MSLLEGQIAAVFSQAFSGIYRDALLYRPNPFADDGAGGGSTGTFGPGEPVKAQVDAATQAMQAADDYVDTGQRILVLAAGIDPITTDAEIVISSQRWSILSAAQDPAGSYYELRGRRKSNA